MDKQLNVDEINNITMEIFNKCKYKDKCFGNMSWCDGMFKKLCRVIQKQNKEKRNV